LAERNKEANVIQETRILKGGKDGIKVDSEVVKETVGVSAIGYGNVEVTGFSDTGEKITISDDSEAPLTRPIPEEDKSGFNPFKYWAEKYIPKALLVKERIIEELLSD